ncbi:hypothetical protein, partial [uncultured Gammaproteobacteria bacterium]
CLSQIQNLMAIMVISEVIMLCLIILSQAIISI